MELLYISCAWIAGIFLGSKAGIPLLALPSGLIPLLFIPLFPNRKKILVVTALCLFAFLGAALRFASSLPELDEHFLRFYNGEVATMQGMVAEEPDVRGRYCLLTFSVREIDVDAVEQVSGMALIRVPRYPAYHYGDVLQVTGELETPAQFEDFDYRAYLARQGIYSVIYYPRVEILARGMGIKPLQWIYSLRRVLSASLARALPEPQGSLAQGILLGIRGNIPDTLYGAFSRTGTAHLLAISGLHLAIVIGMVLSFAVLVFGRLRGIYIWLALIVIWLYALLTGMNPPVIRGTIMGSMFLIGEYMGRQRSGVTALTFAAAVMVGIQPQILWSVSFQLSFLAMAGLIFLYPYFQTWGRHVAATHDREAPGAIGSLIVDGFAVTLAAVIAVWPLVAHNFGIVSLVGLPATFFCLPALPAIIVTAALVAFVGLFAPLAAQILGLLAWLFSSYLIFVVESFDALPFSSFPMAIAEWQVWGYYIALAAAIGLFQNRKQVISSFSSLVSRYKGNG
jgi:competence protein ComEC